MKSLILLLAGALATSFALAQDMGAMPAKDPGKMWQASLARPPMAVSSAFDRRGRVWQARVEQGRVLVSASDDGGKTFAPARQVNAEPEAIAAEGENRPKLAFGPQNQVYVSWTRSLETPFSGHVRFARSLDGGQTFSSPLTVNDNLEPINHRFEALAVDARGRIHLAWLDKRDQAAAARKNEAFSGNSVYYAISSDNGESFSVNRLLAEHSCECCRVALDVEADGTPVAFWRQIYGRNVREFALLRADGQSTPVRVSRDHWEIAACPHHGGAISIDADNTYHLAWFNNGPERRGLFYAQSADRGKSFSKPLAFGDFDAQAAHPHVLAVGAKQVYLVWKEFDGRVSIIKAMRSDNGGARWSPAAAIAQTDGASDHPMLAGNGANAWLSWNTSAEGLRLIDLSATIKPFSE